MPKKRPLFQRLAFSLFVLCAVVVGLEGVLLVASLLVRPSEGRIVGDEGAGVRIMGVGDSWMAGAEAPEGAAFIEVFARAVAGRGGEVAVFNYGRGGTNSAQAYLAAKDNIDEVRPSVLLLLTGANDSTNSAEQAVVDAALGGGISPPARGPLDRLRLVKFLRIGVANLRGEVHEEPPVSAAVPGPRPYTDGLSRDPMAQWFHTRRFAEGLAEAQRIGPGAQAWAPLYLYGLGRDEEAESRAVELLEEDPDGSSRTLLALALGLVHFRADRKERASAPLSTLAAQPDSWFRDLGLVLWALDTDQEPVLARILPRALAARPETPELAVAVALLARDEVGPALAALPETLPPAQRDLRVVRAAPHLFNTPPVLAPQTDPSGSLEALLVLAERLDGRPGAGREEALAAIGKALNESTNVEAVYIERVLWLAAAIRWTSRYAPSGGGGLLPHAAGLPEETAALLQAEPLAALAWLRWEYEEQAPCEVRRQTTAWLLAGGSGVAGIHPFIADCFDNETLGSWEDQHRVRRLGPLQRASNEEVLGRLSLDPSLHQGPAWEQSLSRRLDAILALCQEHDTLMVVLTYPRDPTGRLPENEALRRWAAGHSEVVLADAWERFRSELSDEQWRSLTTPNLHVNGEGYRRIGELVDERVSARRALP